MLSVMFFIIFFFVFLIFTEKINTRFIYDNGITVYLDFNILALTLTPNKSTKKYKIKKRKVSVKNTALFVRFITDCLKRTDISVNNLTLPHIFSTPSKEAISIAIIPYFLEVLFQTASFSTNKFSASNITSAYPEHNKFKLDIGVGIMLFHLIPPSLRLISDITKNKLGEVRILNIGRK